MYLFKPLDAAVHRLEPCLDSAGLPELGRDRGDCDLHVVERRDEPEAKPCNPSCKQGCNNSRRPFKRSRYLYFHMVLIMLSYCSVSAYFSNLLDNCPNLFTISK